MRILSFIILLFFICLHSFSTQGKGKIKYVNPFIGTTPTLKVSNWEGHGRTYPGAVAPFGYIQLTPETRISSGKGYDYSDEEVFFFSCMEHMSGYPHGSSGQCIIQAIENTDSFQLKKDSRSFSHENEKAEPGYYKLVFDDNGTMVETTATTRCGMFRFTYKNSIKPKLFIGDIGNVEFEKDRVVKGSKRNILIEFNTDWSKIEKIKEGIILTFEEPQDKTILLKLSSSSVSIQNSTENLVTEIPDWDFDSLKKNTQRAWEKQLSVIEVNDDSIDNKIKFYSALYHSMLIPWIVSDVNKEYIGGDHKIHKAKGKNHYGAFSPWDTFRSLHPLFCIVAPNRQNDMVVSMLEIYEQTGQLPVEPMTGYHSIPIIVDSYFKNINNFDKTLAYEAMKECIVNEPFFYEDMSSYIEKGYVPASFPESVTRTVEYAYNDWTLSQFAKLAMNQPEDYVKLFNRGFNFRNLFNSEELFLRPRNKQGFVEAGEHLGYKEGNKWNYSLFVPHNVRDLINLMGGAEAFSTHLDKAINDGHILFDNEPNFHIPYLFNYAKSPDKTQEWISWIREQLFTATADGLPGNDDLGSMSSWFVFNAMGFYPVCPGVPEYNIGTPLFKQIAIHQPNGKTFVINAPHTSLKNKYIRSATLNGDDFNQTWFNHAEILNGGEIIFSLGPNPSDWAAHPTSEAFSATKNEAVISIDSLWLSKIEVEPNELIKVNFSLKNTGSTGVKIIRLYNNKKEIARRNILVEEGKRVLDSVSCKLYKPGLTNLTVEGNLKMLTVNVHESKKRKFEISRLSFIPFLKVSSTQEFSYFVKNIGGTFDSTRVEIYINNKLFTSTIVAAGPGETVVQKHKTSDLKTGINTLQVQNLAGVFKVYADKKMATLIDLGFSQTNSRIIKDKSGFSNHGMIKTTNSESSDFTGFDENSFVEIKNSPEFSFLKNEITMMAWVKFSNADNYPVSIITQGDQNVIQLLNKNTIQFFAGGWGRGECNAVLSANLHNGWHHLTGVADALSLKLYVDGELIETVVLDKSASLVAEANWNLGRNEEFPGQRIFNGKMDGVKIFALALSQKEIVEIMNKGKIK